MFGFGKSKSEKLALKIESLMITMEAAADQGKWNVVVYISQQQVKVLRDIRELDEWSEERLDAYLRKRGMVKSLIDDNYASWFQRKVLLHNS